MTPMVNVGGEPFKIAAVAPWLGLRRAAGSVVVYQILHTLGMLLSFLTAGGVGGPPLPPHPAVLPGPAPPFVRRARRRPPAVEGAPPAGGRRAVGPLASVPP